MTCGACPHDGNVTSFSQMASEIGVSRVYVGYHFRLAVTEGLKQGQSVGSYVAQHVLAPI